MIFQRPQEPAKLIDGRDHDWAATCEALKAEGVGPLAPEPVKATDPLCAGRPRSSMRASQSAHPIRARSGA